MIYIQIKISLIFFIYGSKPLTITPNTLLQWFIKSQIKINTNNNLTMYGTLSSLWSKPIPLVINFLIPIQLVLLFRSLIYILYLFSFLMKCTSFEFNILELDDGVCGKEKFGRRTIFKLDCKKLCHVKV